MSDRFDSLLRILSVDTTTGVEHRGEAALRTLLPEHGWHLEEQPVSDDRKNLLWTTDEAPRVLLTTHYDTVPPYVPPRIEDGVLHGRGACDAKGILWAMCQAAEACRARGEHRVAVLAVVGEETHSDGAKAAVKALEGRWPDLRYVIDGEPTDNGFLRGALGVLGLEIEATGCGGHSAYPERGPSAVHDLLHALEVLRSESWPVDETFGPTTLNVGLISGGDAVNVLARAAKAALMFRVSVPGSQVLARAEELLGDLPVSWRQTTSSDPLRFWTPEDVPTEVARFGSDLPYLKALGAPIQIGPGSIHVAHTSHEQVVLTDLERAAEIYADLTLRLAQ
ncbi:MAG: M20/M25/M40 family metallo-hydrolase [Planctomycetota bacterium]